MKKASVVMSRLRSEAGFTLVELIAAVALLVILLAILMVVFRAAGSTVAIGQDRVATYRTVRAFFMLLEDDLTNALLITQGGTTYGLVGQNATDEWFLYDDTNNNERYDPGEELPKPDRLTLVRPRRGFVPSALKPGYVDACYLRIKKFPDPEMRERRNALVKAMDEERSGEIGTYESSASSWAVGDPLPLGFGGPATFPTESDAGYSTYLGNHDDDFMNYLIALNVSDLQFEYLGITSPTSPATWQNTWDPGTDTYDPDGPGGVAAQPALPLAVKVAIYLPVDPRESAQVDVDDVDNHIAFTHTIYLPMAP